MRSTIDNDDWTRSRRDRQEGDNPSAVWPVVAFTIVTLDVVLFGVWLVLRFCAVGEAG